MTSPLGPVTTNMLTCSMVAMKSPCCSATHMAGESRRHVTVVVGAGDVFMSRSVPGGSGLPRPGHPTVPFPLVWVCRESTRREDHARHKKSNNATTAGQINFGGLDLAP